MKKTIGAVVVFFLCIFSINAQNGGLQKLEDNLYVISNLGGNVAFLITSDGVLVVDAGSSPGNGQQIVDAIQSVTDKTIRYVVLTHYHYDHTYGLQSFLPQATVVCTKNCASNMQSHLETQLKESLAEFPGKIDLLKKELSDKRISDSLYTQLEASIHWHTSSFDDLKQVVIQKPDTIIEENTTLYLGKDTVELIVPASGHTNGNMVILFKNYNTIHLGDLFFNKLHPYVDWQAGSDVSKWIATLEGVASEKYRTIIPGHGEVANTADLHETIVYMKKMRLLVQSKIDKGVSLDETIASIKPNEFKSIGFEWMLPKTIEGFYMNLSRK